MTTQGKILTFVLALAILGFGGWYVSTKLPTAETVTENQQYVFAINGERIALVNGTHEKESVPGSASKTITTYFGNEAKGDFNSDGKEDAAFLVTQSIGGSGTFFYLATTLEGEAVLLGDRIAPQTTEWRDGKIIVNYADRKPGEPMTTAPSVGVSKYYEVQGNTLVEVAGPTEPASPAGGTVEAGQTQAQQCASMGGTWSEQYKECAGISESACREIGGTFNECASACRHNPDAQACIMMCVVVCSF